VITTQENRLEEMLVLGIRQPAALEQQGRNVVVRHLWGATSLGQLDPGARDTISQLLETPATLRDLVEHATSKQGRDANLEVATLLWALKRIDSIVTRCLMWQGSSLLTIVPITSQSQFPLHAAPVRSKVTLSRFASLRADGCSLLLESPLSRHRVEITDARVGAILSKIALCGSQDALRRAPRAMEQAILMCLNSVSMLSRVDVNGDPSEAPEWEAHDLLFHWRSRRGEHDYAVGAKSEPKPPVHRTRVWGSLPAVVLPKPDLANASAADPSLTDALESRRSIRTFGGEPIAVQQLSELLFRVTGSRPVGADHPFLGEPSSEIQSRRPYPSAGAAYELDLYLAVRRCRGLDPGAYVYDAARHAIVAIPCEQQDLRSLLREGAAAARTDSLPDVHLVLVSQFSKLSTRYSSIAYALTLMNVGVLYQTMYLVAFTMGLAPCALGSGDSEVAARVFGLDPLVDCPVGEFLLGTIPSRLSLDHAIHS
jgi:SagB-type dehydrogenase family enzyme